MNSPIQTTNRAMGFTLLELLIAISVFSILSTITYSGLKTVLDTEQQTSSHIDRLAKIQIGLNIAQRDIEQSTIRQIRDEFGDTQPAMRSGDLTGILLEFTHGGYSNPMGYKRSALQRTAYQLEDSNLLRITWPSLDRAQETSPRKIVLLEQVKSAEINYYDQQMKPHEEWPTNPDVNTQNSQYPLPRAVEFILELEKVGRIRRLFRVAELVVN